ncbi:MAG: type II secretion system F family protein [Candidatus Delongbacteria bacterium]|jgi:type II secretory pathway component PulF|nr:type II secretion system F family protein [Candidatus Delongbacteria bacterium]
MYYSIGEFSKLTNLTPKMLKLYQEKELLIPAKIDEFSKYRYYSKSNLETANLIIFFKQFDLSLAEIKEIVDNQDDESVLAELLEKQKDVIEDKITKYNFVMGLINEKLKRSTIMSEIDNTSKLRSRFWKIFAKLIKQDISVIDSLKTAGKSADEELKAVLPDIINEVKEGNKLHDILNKSKTVFTELEIMVIYAGEESEHLYDASYGIGDFLAEIGYPDNVEGEKNTRSKYWKTFGFLLTTGISVTKGMEIASEWADEKLRNVTNAMIEEIINGHDLYTALKNRPKIFTELEIEMDRIGEIYGNLHTMILKLPNIVRMIEETEDEPEKRKNFWKVIGDYEGIDFETYDSKIYDSICKSINYMNEKFKLSRKLPVRSNFHFYPEVIRLALFAADDKLKNISEEILKDLTDNKTLSSVMEKFPDIFQEFETKFIALGENNKDIGKAANELVEIL